jgi:hypothetical protein
MPKLKDAPGTKNDDLTAGSEPPELENAETAYLGSLSGLVGQGDGSISWEIYRLPENPRQVPQGVDPRDGTYEFSFPGVFDVEIVREQCGGGYFRVNGRRSDGTFFKRGVRFGIAGPPRLHVSPNPVAAPAAIDSNVLELKRELVQMREELRAALATPKSDPLRDQLMQAAIGHMLDSPGANTAAPLTPDSLFKILDRGIEMAQARGEAGESWISVAKQYGGEILEILRDARRPAPGAAPPGARVPLPTSPPIARAANPRALWLVVTLERALERGLEPAALADDVEDFLSELELAQLKAASAEQLIAQLARIPEAASLVTMRKGEGDQPVIEIRREGLAVYLAAFLEQLRTPASE